MEKGMFWMTEGAAAELEGVNVLALTGYVLIYNDSDTQTEAFDSGLATELE